MQTEFGDILGEDRSITRLFHIVSDQPFLYIHACWQDDIPTLPRSKRARTVRTVPLL